MQAIVGLVRNCKMLTNPLITGCDGNAKTSVKSDIAEMHALVQ